MKTSESWVDSITASVDSVEGWQQLNLSVWCYPERGVTMWLMTTCSGRIRNWLMLRILKLITKSVYEQPLI